MTNSRDSKPVKRERQRITRTACEPCREKRAKCDGEKPCGRCQTRNLDCHFTQRTWASKRSLQDEATSLREQVHRRDRVLDAICSSDSSGDDILRMLREGGLSYDEAYERVRGVSEASSSMNVDTKLKPTRHNSTGSCECETCWSPSTAHSNVLSSASGHSPFSFMEHAMTDDTVSQHSTFSEQIPQQPNPLQQQMDPMQSIPWATSGPDANSFGTMLEGTTMVPPVSTGIAGDCPTVIDPMLWPPVNSSDPLGQPMLNSWTGLMSDPTDASKARATFGTCVS
ncbi:hypothetical protein NLU13_4597 [Sarocladium strictum]|uniref:Zn(2)-C6 fungal-type domain-containing protein n=1 Tax=Sarocladium strictum TaxID=5046 RepID=A0AA39L8T5_SARSR|nr:hypothetical protein NLU13_4597 [Sarocladium strictum]